jgi:hypothetical protein
MSSCIASHLPPPENEGGLGRQTSRQDLGCQRATPDQTLVGLVPKSSILGSMTYIVQRVDRFYVVVYDGLDPLSGKERRRWHPAGHHRDEAETVAAHIDQDQAGAERACSGALTRDARAVALAAAPCDLRRCQLVGPSVTAVVAPAGCVPPPATTPACTPNGWRICESAFAGCGS